VVKGQIGLTRVKQATAEFTLTIRNPCIDPQYVKIIPSDPPSGIIDYTMFTGMHSKVFHSQEPFKLETKPIEHNLCGILNYPGYVDGLRMYKEDFI
jgi:hypothetical protein